jgi:hypothetical protein
MNNREPDEFIIEHRYVYYLVLLGTYSFGFWIVVYFTLTYRERSRRFYSDYFDCVAG